MPEITKEARAALERPSEIVARYIRFDNYQQHQHSWHDLQDCLEKLRAWETEHTSPSGDFPLPIAQPSKLSGAEITNEARAALERLRRYESGEPLLEIYCPRAPGAEWTHMAPAVACSRLKEDREIAAAELLRLAPLIDRWGETANRLHQQIMNLPCPGNKTNETMGYKIGHRDARHAAAELVLAALSLAEQPSNREGE
jgi:hypothetical protein